MIVSNVSASSSAFGLRLSENLQIEIVKTIKYPKCNNYSNIDYILKTLPEGTLSLVGEGRHHKFFNIDNGKGKKINFNIEQPDESFEKLANFIKRLRKTTLKQNHKVNK